VARHDIPEDLWLAFLGKVVNLTSLVLENPGAGVAASCACVCGAHEGRRHTPRRVPQGLWFNPSSTLRGLTFRIGSMPKPAMCATSQLRILDVWRTLEYARSLSMQRTRAHARVSKTRSLRRAVFAGAKAHRPGEWLGGVLHTYAPHWTRYTTLQFYFVFCSHESLPARAAQEPRGRLGQPFRVRHARPCRCTHSPVACHGAQGPVRNTSTAPPLSRHVACGVHRRGVPRGTHLATCARLLRGVPGRCGAPAGAAGQLRPLRAQHLVLVPLR
jgi:hypothetical protein